MRKIAKHLNLQRLIVGLAILSAGVMLANAVFAAYQVQREQLINNALESNRVYAHKLAQTTHNFLVSTQQQLEYSARTSDGIFPDPTADRRPGAFQLSQLLSDRQSRPAREQPLRFCDRQVGPDHLATNL